MKFQLLSTRGMFATILAMATIISHPARGATITWTNMTGGDWNTPANWNNGVLPGPGDDVVINLLSTNITVTYTNGNSAFRSIQCSGAFVLSGGSITVTAGASRFTGPFTASGGASLSVNGAGTSLAVTGSASINGAGLNANSGGVLSFPTVGSYQEPGGCGSLTWQANGAGSVLNLPALTNLTGGNCGALDIQALAGGLVELSNVVALADGNISAYAGGSNSVVDLSGLPGYQGTNFTLSVEAQGGGKVLLPQMTEVNRINVTLDAEGFISTAQIRSLGVANLTVNGGSTLSLPGVGSYQEPGGCGSLTWQANGAGSVLNLSALTNLTGGNCGNLNIEALAGGLVELSNVVALADGNISAYAGGSNSVVDLSGLPGYQGTNFTLSVEAQGGGKVLLPQLADVNRLNLTLDAGGFISTAQIRSLGVANLTVNGGSTLSLPGVGSYQEPGGCGSLTWQANGAGSVLNLSALTNLTGGNCGALDIQALAGGLVELSNVVALADGNISAYAGGSNSVVDVSGLPGYQGTNFTLSVEAQGGGRVLLPQLTEVNRINVTLDAGGFISTTQIRSLATANLAVSGGSTLSLPGVGSYQEPGGCGSLTWQANGAGSVLNLSALTNLTGGNCGNLNIQALAGGLVVLSNVVTVVDGNISAYAGGSNSVVDLSGLPGYQGTNFTLSVEAQGGGRVLLPQLADVNRLNLTLDAGGFISTAQIRSLGVANLTVNGGSILSLPGVGSYQEPGGCGSLTWQANGAGSVLNLSALTNLTGGNCGNLNIQALAGGLVVLSNVVTVVDGNISAYAGGSNSVVDLSGLPGYQGTNFTLSVEAQGGGRVLLPQLAEVNRLNLTLDAGGFISTMQIRRLGWANLAVSGGSILSLPGVGTYQEPGGCGSLTWQANGVGSVLNLPALTNLTGGNCGNLNIQALGGGLVVLSNVVTVVDGNVSTTADGTNSLVDLSGLANYEGAGYTLSLGASGGGNIPLIKLSTISAGTVLLTGQTTMALQNIEVFSGAALNCSGDLLLNGFETIASQPGGLIKVGGNLLGNTRNADLYAPQGTLELGGGAHQLEAMSQDMGNVPGGYVQNFAYGTIALDSGAQVTLVDQSVNSSGQPPECVYANSLSVPAGATLNLNGLHLYARLTQIAGSVTGGTISQAPDNGGVIVPGPGIPASISKTGALDAWTFFGRAGQTVAVAVNPDSPSVLPPPLNFAYVQLLDPLTNLLAQASNTVPQQIVALTDIILPMDGTYTVLVRSPANALASTGNYEVAVWNAPRNVAPLVVNQQVHGLLQTPYSIDQWNFSAAAGQQMQFDLANVSAPGIAFNFSGPNGWSGFSNLVASSGLITLPASGAYNITAYGTGGAYGMAYAFEVAQTAETNLALGATLAGQFSGNGQAQLFAITVTNGSPLLVTLNNAGANNATELYVKLGSPPTRGIFDFQSANSSSGNQQILIPQAVPGTYYILVYGNYIPTPGSYTIQAQPASLFLTGATPNFGAHNATLSMTLTGAGFVSSTGVQLAATNGTPFPATTVAVDSFTQITASFASNTVPAGTYSVVVAQGNNRAALTNVLTIAPAGAPQLETKLILPEFLGRHAVATLYVEYANTGSAAMPAPLLVLQGIGPASTIKPVITLDSSRIVQNFWSSVLPPGTGNKVYILGSGAQAGVLNPGERIQVPVYYLGLQQPWDFSQNSVVMGIRYWTADNTNSIDWSAREASFRPPNLDSNSWDIIYHNITVNLTNSGAYIQMLDNAAQFLSRLGEHVTDVDSLWNFAVQQATGFQAVPVLDSAADAALPTPGIALEFDRHYSSSVAARNRMGPFGLGWYTPWQATLAVQDGGALVELLGEAGSARAYTLDSRSGAYFSSAGDSSTLTALSGGIYELSDAGGDVIWFRADGKINYATDLNGNAVTAGYDGSGRLIALSHTSGASLSFTYNAAGLIVKTSDSAGRSVIYGYDATKNHLLTATTDDGKATVYAYQTSGSPAQQQALASVTRGGVTRYFTFDTFGRLASTYLGATNQPIQLTYDPSGAVLVTDAQGTTSLYFDYLGLLAKITDPLGNSTTAQFDDNLRLSQLVSPTGDSEEFSWCDCGSLAGLTDPLGHSITLQHDNPFKRMTGFTDARGNTTSYAYDSKGNLLATTFPDNSSEQFGNYNASGFPQGYVNRRNQAVSQTYSASGQVETRTLADGSYFAFNYDARGNLLAVTNHPASGADQVTTYTYNYAADGDRVRQITYPNGRWVALTHDAYGRRAQITDSTGRTNNYGYDDAGRLAEVSDDAGNPLVGYLYNPAGRVQRINKVNGTYTTYDYDAGGNVLSLVNLASGGATNSFFNYTYDSHGRRSSLATLDGNWTYSYDVLGQLLHAVFVSGNPGIPNQDLQYLYDASGNRIASMINGVTTNYVANSLNEYTKVGGTAWQYDADGNLVFDGANTNSYNQQNQLISVSGPAGLTQYEYDALGNRTASVFNGQRTEYLIDPTGNVLAENDGAGNLLAQNVYGLGLAGRTSGGNLDWYDFDALGSVAGITGAGSGYLNHYSYLPFGGTLASAGALANPFTFDGQDGVTSDATQLFHAQSRTYDPQAGRFGSIDPLRLNGGKPDDYAYTGNDPVLMTDPSGQCFILGGVNGGPNNFVGFTFGTSTGYSVGGSVGAGVGVSASFGPGGILGPAANFGLASGGAGAYAGAGVGVSAGAHVGASLGYSQGSTYGLAIGWGWGGGCPPPGNITIVFPCDGCDDGGGDGDDGDDGGSGTAGSFDPNELIGPAGYAVQNYVATAGNLFAYEILFENETNATAPAQEVQVTDQLSTNLDWQTFQLTQIGFGDQIIFPPANSQHFQTNVAFTYGGVSFEVQIEAGIQPASGQIFANFVSVDPLTSLPPAVNIGFLPPEDGTGRGIGHVSYSVSPKPNLPTGTQITNVALIQFDVNPVIATDQADPNDPSKGIDPAKEALVTIDNTPPVSAVLPLPAIEPTTNFTVSWSGTDVGSGIASYDIYDADNTNAWTLWLAGTTNTSAIFTGQNGHTYGFHSVAHDDAGNMESPHSAADTSTTVNVSAFELSISLARSAGGQINQAILTFPTSAGYNYVVEYRSDLTPGTLWQALPGAPHNSGTVIETNLVGEQYYRVQKSPK